MRSSVRAIAILSFSVLVPLFGASPASATSLYEDTSWALDHPLPYGASVLSTLATGASTLIMRTDGTLANTCTSSTVVFKNQAAGEYAGGEAWWLEFAGCTNPVTVHRPGNIWITGIWASRHGTVFSEGAEVTVATSLGFTINCKTGAGTHIGRLEGVYEGEHARMEINAVLNCGFLLPSAKWVGAYDVTSPTGLYVWP